MKKNIHIPTFLIWAQPFYSATVTLHALLSSRFQSKQPLLQILIVSVSLRCSEIVKSCHFFSGPGGKNDHRLRLSADRLFLGLL
jgi:hypothetical protein